MKILIRVFNGVVCENPLNIPLRSARAGFEQTAKIKN
ncbi:hypothetical protein BSAF29S_02132 [Bacillus safensis subsp. safensis]